MTLLTDLSQSDAEVFVPDGRAEDEAFADITHLGIAAHADDLEIMAYHGIREGQSSRAGFGGVVCTDGVGAPTHEDDSSDLRDTRRDEQRAAARRGRYLAAIQLDHPSEALKAGVEPAIVGDLAGLLDAARPQVVYTHSPADIHATHVGVCVATLDAIRSLPPGARPGQVLGCEVWGGLDWLASDAAIALDLGGDDASWSALMRVFGSQIRARPYDRGALGRSRANAVFREARETGGSERLWLAIDLTPLIRDDDLDLEAFVGDHLARFERSVLDRIASARGH